MRRWPGALTRTEELKRWARDGGGESVGGGLFGAASVLGAASLPVSR